MVWNLGFGWQKTCHTNVLTTAQKYKRTLFCRKLLRLSNQNLIRIISAWIFTDEKWFDICGPSPGQWVRAETKAARKMGNQVSVDMKIWSPRIQFNLTSPSPYSSGSQGQVEKRRSEKTCVCMGGGSVGSAKPNYMSGPRVRQLHVFGGTPNVSVWEQFLRRRVSCGG